MKRLKKAAALLALALSCAGLWAEVRPAEEFDREAQEYKEYWLSASQKYSDSKLLYADALMKFQEKNPQCILAYIDGTTAFFQQGFRPLAAAQFQRAALLLPTVPDSEEGKFSKARYYRLSSELSLFVLRSESAAEKDAELCAQYNGLLGAEAYYNLASYYSSADKALEAVRCYNAAFDLDKGLSRVSADDFSAFQRACEKRRDYMSLAQFYDQYISESDGGYVPSFGALAMSAYERAKRKDKAVFAAALDREFALTYADSGEGELIQALKKHFGKDKAAAACIAFVQKFYGEGEALSQADMDSLPADVQSFLPARYMFDMKNKGEASALRGEYERFFGTIGNFYIRLYEKAERAGDKKMMEELKEILDGERFNKNGKNRLIKKIEK